MVCLQAVQVYEQALEAQPTGRMYSLNATYLQYCLDMDVVQQQASAQLSAPQQAILHSRLQLYKRAHSAGQHFHSGQQSS